MYSYTAFLGDAGSAGGYWAGSDKTPQLAIAAVYARVLQEFKKTGSFVAMFEKAELYSLLRD